MCATMCNLFWPDGELRQIIDRRPRNAAEPGPPADAPKKGRPSSFLGLVVPVEGCLRGCMDDLRNFYRDFSVPLERALSMAVGPLWRARDCQGSEALRELQRRRPTIHIHPGMKLRACFAGLSMGDSWAPALAQASHEGVLRAFDALRPDEHLQLGRMLPRAPQGHYSGVCIDDRVGVQIFDHACPAEMPGDATMTEYGGTRGSVLGPVDGSGVSGCPKSVRSFASKVMRSFPSNIQSKRTPTKRPGTDPVDSHMRELPRAPSSVGRDLEASTAADSAYEATGLQIHPKKKVRRASVFKAWGAQCEGDRALYSPLIELGSRLCVCVCVCTAKAAAGKASTERLLQKLLGLWAFAFQFRRPLFSLFEECTMQDILEGLPMSHSACQSPCVVATCCVLGFHGPQSPSAPPRLKEQA